MHEERPDREIFDKKVGKFDFRKVPLDDPRVWSLFARGDTVGVFQLEKQLGRDWSKRAKPSNIEELAALISILRPGVLETGQADLYVKIKNGQEEPRYLHPSLEPILKDTHSCLLYQEESINIAKVIAGLTEEEADTYIRKGIGKKLPEVIAKVKSIFLDGCAKKGIVNQKEAEEIFGWIEKGQRYLFNKSHAVTYAFNAYWSAYIKYHYPKQFYCSWLTFSSWKPNPREEIYELVQNAKINGVNIITPDIRVGNADFKIIGDDIAFGLSHIRGVGGKGIENITKNSENFKTFEGFVKTAKKIKRNVAESLIKSGACDFYQNNRMYMLKVIQAVYGFNAKEEEYKPIELKKLSDKELAYFLTNVEKLGLINTLEDIINLGICQKNRIDTIKAKINFLQNGEFNDSNRQKSIWEKLYLGISLSCSSADDFSKEKGAICCREAFFAKSKEKITIHCVVDDIRLRQTSERSKTPGKNYCYLNVSDNSGAVQNIVCWPETYDNYKEQLSTDLVVSLKAVKNSWNGKDQIVVNSIDILG